MIHPYKDTFRNTCGWRIGLTETFRNRSAKLLDKYGTNLQNPSDHICRMYEPDSGKVFVQVDQAGAEALIVAYLCKGPNNLRKLFEHNIKPHVYVAMHLFKSHWQRVGHPIVNAAIEAPIEALKLLPKWKELETAIKKHERYYFIGKKTCHACVDEKTEVLTPNGWVPIYEAMNREDSIMTYDKDNDLLQFEKPLSWYSSFIDDNIFKIETPSIVQYVTRDHRVLYYSNNSYHTKTISELFDIGFSGKLIPTAGQYKPEFYRLWSMDRIKLLVAIQADGSFTTKSNIRFRFRKGRKFYRLTEILSKLSYKYSYTYHMSEDVYELNLDDPYQEFYYMLGQDRMWDKWLFEFSCGQLLTLVNELKYWDGTIFQAKDSTTKRESYTNKHKSNIDWINTILHLVNKRGSPAQYPRVWTVGISDRKYSRLNKNSIKKFLYKGYIYCPQTLAGYFLIRRSGTISITGNSNYDMGPKTFRMAVLTESEGKTVISHQDATIFLETYHKLFPEIREWHNETTSILRKTRTLRNLFGYPRLFTGPMQPHTFKEAFAFVPQSTVGVLGNMAFVEEQGYIEEHGKDWDLLNNKHDSTLTQCPIDEAQECAEVKRKIVEKELMSPWGEMFKMRSEASVGYNWGHYDEKENPKGLKEL